MDVTADAVENLVTQFSSALDFYRELIQNSMDAGSDVIDVWLEFIESEDADTEGGPGVIAIHVDDFGEGMNEEIIDSQLTTLFSSTKENDLTKIGKFGIGFVSVFAIRPKGVLVHTGRGGEYWEVFFHEDRSFNKARVPTPVEGTQITLFVEGDRTRYRELVADSRRTIKHWVSHSDVEVTFEDRSASDGDVERINEPFAVEGACHTRVQVEGSEMVLAYTASAVHGFYNKGLALAVESASAELAPGRFRHVSFKIKSRYLEHTLARETVMRDHNYEKAIKLLRDAASGPLRQALVDAICEMVRQPETWALGTRERYLELVGYLAEEGPSVLERLGEVPLLRALSGRAYSLESIYESLTAEGHVFIASESTAVTEVLVKEDVPVLLGRGDLLERPRGQGAPTAMGTVARLVTEYVYMRSGSGIIGAIRGIMDDLETEARASVVRPEDVFVGVQALSVGQAGSAGRLVARAAELLGTLDFAPTRGRRAALRHGWVYTPKEHGLGYANVVPARMEGDRRRPPLFVVGAKVRSFMALPPAGVPGGQGMARPEVAVNVDHPEVRFLAKLAERHLDLAAYALARNLLVSEQRELGSALSMIESAGPGQQAKGEGRL